MAVRGPSVSTQCGVGDPPQLTRSGAGLRPRRNLRPLGLLPRSAQVSDLAATPTAGLPKWPNVWRCERPSVGTQCGVGDPRTARALGAGLRPRRNPRPQVSLCARRRSPTSPQPPTAGLLKWPNACRCERPSVGTKCGVGDPPHGALGAGLRPRRNPDRRSPEVAKRMAVRETFGQHPVRGRRPAHSALGAGLRPRRNLATARSAQVSDLAATSDRRSPEVAKRVPVRETFGRQQHGVRDPRTAHSAQVSDLAATSDRRSPDVAKRMTVRETFGRQQRGVGDPRTARSAQVSDLDATAAARLKN